MQLIPKSLDKTICSCSHNNNHKNKIKNDKDNDTQLEKEDPANKDMIIGDSKLNNINSRVVQNEKCQCIEFFWGNQHRHFNEN